MARPGTQITLGESAPPRSAPTDTGVWFVVGTAEKGAQEPILVRSLSEFKKKLGGRQSYSVLYDSIETYFREGGSKAYVSRVLGPAAVKASATVTDAEGATVFTVQANSEGEWGNALNVEVKAGDAPGTYIIVVSHEDDGELERSPDLVDKDAGLAWADRSDYIELVPGASTNNPKVQGPTSLAGGTDDRANITDAQWLAALNRFTKDLGPGQVSAPGRTSTTGHIQLLNHAGSNNRIAILDGPDTPSKTTLMAAAAAARSGVTTGNERFGGLFAPWAVIPGFTSGTTRTVPYSAVQAGLIARNDGLGYSPNIAAAGDLGRARYAIDLSQPAWSDDDREDLNEAGVNVARLVYGGVRTYGFRTLADPTTDSNWIQLSSSRLIMHISAQADAIAEKFLFRQLDGRRLTIKEFEGELVGMLTPLWASGSLFGDTPDEAFNVDTGDQVNTVETIANGELRAVIAVKISPFAEFVEIEIVKTRTQEAVA